MATICFYGKALTETKYKNKQNKKINKTKINKTKINKTKINQLHFSNNYSNKFFCDF